MNMNDIYEKRNNFFLKPSPMITGLSTILLVIGAVAMGYGFYANPDNRQHVWGAFLFNLFFFFSIGLGGMAFSAIQDVVGAHWSRPIKRIMESFSFFVYLSIFMFIVFLIAVYGNILGAGDVYSWIKEPSVVEHFFGKNIWLQKNFMMIRSVFILAVIGLCVRWQLKMVLERDHILISGDRDKALAKANETKFKLRLWSGLVLIMYGFGLTFFGMDIMMSLSPLWFSTLFGGWQLAIMMQSLMATLLIIMFILKNTEIGTVFKRQQFHDVGKLMYGFSCFFAYLTFAHILTYWYGNVPEETEYFIHRLHEPWKSMLYFVAFSTFVIPLYLFMFKAAKWTALIAVPMALLVLSGQWITNLIVVIPEVTSPDNFNLGLLEVGLFLGFLGLFIKTILSFGKRHPMVGVADPLLAEALKGDH